MNQRREILSHFRARTQVRALPGTGFQTLTDTTASPGMQYFYRVKAVNGPVSTAYEGPVSVITPGIAQQNPGVVPNRP